MGVKKSTVCTSAISSVILYTPASSAVEISTRRFGSCCGGSSARACPNTVGLIFDAQPAQATRLVSFHCFCLRNIALSLLCMGGNVFVPYCSASWTILPGVFHWVRALRDSIRSGSQGARRSEHPMRLSAAERPRVFDRFYRRKGIDAYGRGLGLAIVKTIAEHH